MQNISKEDYLSIIYKHKDIRGEIKANIIAEKLQVSNAAVTDMIKKLSKDGFIDYKKYKWISLTPKGEEYARKMVRRHRIWEVFLNQIVGISWGKVHDEANRLEHSSSDELIDRMEEMLNFPKYDPHGDPIPSKDGKLPILRKLMPLSALMKGEIGLVIRVNDFDESFLFYISELGIKLKEKIKILEKRHFDDSLMILINGEKYNVSKKLADNVFVQKI